MALQTKRCTKTDCSECETCIYDEGYLEDGVNENNNNMEKTKTYTFCSDCPHVIKKLIFTESQYYNYYCGKETNPYAQGMSQQRFIEVSYIPNKVISSPCWCPLKIKAEKERFANGEGGNIVPFSQLGYSERHQRWMMKTPLIKWEDIKEDEIYHIPPMMGEKRKDVVIVFKTAYSAAYKEIGPGASAVQTTFYPSTMFSKFLTKNKLKEIKLIKK